MRGRALLVLVALAVIAFATAQPAEAGIRFHYSSGHWNIHGRFGGWPRTWYLPGYSYYYYPAPVYRHHVSRYTTLPLLSIGRLPYIPPGTIYSVDSSAYRSYRYTGYPYDYWPVPAYSFTGAYLATAPGASTSSQAAAQPTVQPSAQPVQNTVNVVVQVTPQEAVSTNVAA